MSGITDIKMNEYAFLICLYKYYKYDGYIRVKEFSSRECGIGLECTQSDSGLVSVFIVSENVFASVLKDWSWNIIEINRLFATHRYFNF